MARPRFSVGARIAHDDAVSRRLSSETDAQRVALMVIDLDESVIESGLEGLSAAYGRAFERHGLADANYGVGTYGEPFVASANFGAYSAITNGAGMSEVLYMSKIKDGRYMVYCADPDYLPSPRAFGITDGRLPIPSVQSLDALLTDISSGRIGDLIVDVTMNHFWDNPAPAAPGTLAGVLFRNLAYAPQDERCDLLLLEDAKEKVRLASEFRKIRLETYRNAIKRLE